MHRLPPLNALRVFEVAARTGSYAEAGAELGLTHGAVSRQIAALETWLGQRLFIRSGRRMTATPAARAFAAEVSLSFDRMIAAAEACGRPSARHILRVSAPTTFAIRWLIPRLEQFHAGNREVEVTVTTTTTLHDELRGGFDVAIRRGSAEQGAWPQYQALSLLQEADTLIVSPALFERAPLRRAGGYRETMSCWEVRHVPAIGPIGWNVPTCRIEPNSSGAYSTISLSRYRQWSMVLGIGVGPLPVLQADLAAGRLLTPFPTISCHEPAMLLLFLSMPTRRRS